MSLRSKPARVHLTLLSQAHEQGGGLEVEQARLKPVSTWDNDVASSSLTRGVVTAPSARISRVNSH